MKVLLAVALTVVMLASFAGGALAQNAFDSFVYTAGQDLDTQNGGVGWAGAWAYEGPDPFEVVAPTLSFPGYTAAGNAVKVQGSSFTVAQYRRQLDATHKYGGNNTTYWFRYLVKPTVDHGQFAGLRINGPSGYRWTFGVTSSGPSDYLTIERSAGGPLASSSFLIIPNSTYLCATRLTVDGAGNGSLDSFLYRDNAGVPQFITSTSLGASTGWGGLFDTVRLYSSGEYILDGLRFGPDEERPIPEAGTMIAFGSFLSMGGLFIRRKMAKRSA